MGLLPDRSQACDKWGDVLHFPARNHGLGDGNERLAIATVVSWTSARLSPTWTTMRRSSS